MDIGAAGGAGHLPHARRQAPGAVVGDAGVEAQVAGFEQKIGHLLLRNRVANLHGRRGGPFVQFLGRERRAVNAVLADASAAHDNQVAGPRALFVAGLPGDGAGNDAAGTAEHERFAKEPFMKHDGAVDVGNAALVAAVLDAPVHAAQDPPRMEQAGRNFAVKPGRGETEHVGVENAPAPHARAQNVAIDAHDARDRAAVGVERRRTVVGLAFQREVVVVVEPD